MIKILKMTQDGFDHYMLFAIKNYANEKVNNGTWESKDALSNSKKQYALLLPDGLQTANHYFYSIFNKEEKIGYIWLAKDDENKQSAFIYDFEIYEEFQNLGFGSKTLDLVADKAKELGFSFLGLHVFGSNSRALHVYKKMGFQITDINMRKEL